VDKEFFSGKEQWQKALYNPRIAPVWSADVRNFEKKTLIRFMRETKCAGKSKYISRWRSKAICQTKSNFPREPADKLHHDISVIENTQHYGPTIFFVCLFYIHGLFYLPLYCLSSSHYVFVPLLP
jgi:hypothetical protein